MCGNEGGKVHRITITIFVDIAEQIGVESLPGVPCGRIGEAACLAIGIANLEGVETFGGIETMTSRSLLCGWHPGRGAIGDRGEGDCLVARRPCVLGPAPAVMEQPVAREPVGHRLHVDRLADDRLEP